MQVLKPNNVSRSLFAIVFAMAVHAVPAAEGVATDGDAASAPARSVARPVSPLDRRVALLARELDLDAAQQSKVKGLLERQRQQVSLVWQDESAPGAIRVQRTQTISERTEDSIRALLTDEQKAKYFKPRPAGIATGGNSGDLAKWMDKMNGR